MLSHARSNYVAAPTLAAFNREARREDVQRIGVVATPCQALALAKMRASPLENRNNIDKLSLVIGLFCTWALDYDGFTRFLATKTPLDRVTKLDIPPPPANVFHVFAGAETLSIPLDEVRPLHPARLQRLPGHDGGVRGRRGRRRGRHRGLEHAYRAQRTRPGTGRRRARRPASSRPTPFPKRT